MAWTKSKESADLRHDVMLGVIRGDPTRGVSLLDFGCGTSQLLERIRERGLSQIEYVGLDVSEPMLLRAREKFPDVDYLNVDILSGAIIPSFDYVVASGTFTIRVGLSFENAFSYFRASVEKLFDVARIGLAVNVLSSQVEWERDDLFHLPMDAAAQFFSTEISRHFVIRHDYGLYEYTAYVYREPADRVA